MQQAIPGEGKLPSLAGRTGLPDVYRSLYEGWLALEQPAISDMDRYVSELILPFSGGWIETRQFVWSRTIDSTFSTSSRCYMLNLSLDTWDSVGFARNLNFRGGGEGDPIRRMFLVPPDQTIRLSSNAGRSRSIRCMIDAAYFDPLLPDRPVWAGNGQAAREAFGLQGSQIEWLLRHMYREVREPDFATPRVVELIAQQLTAEIIRSLKLRRQGSTFKVGGLSPWRMRLIRQRLWSDEPLPSVLELANLCDLTERHLSRSFRKETGETIGNFMKAAMVDRANRMLGSGSSVANVASSLGYTTSASFTAAFRRATGLLPSEITPGRHGKPMMPRRTSYLASR